MSFIAKNPLIIPVVNENTLVPPEGTRGFFLKEDGWYKVSPDGTTSKVNSNTSSGSFIDIEVSSTLRNQTLETISTNIPELDDLESSGEAGIYRLHSNAYAVDEYAFCIVSPTSSGITTSQTLFLDNGIYTRNGVLDGIGAFVWQPWAKLVTEADVEIAKPFIVEGTYNGAFVFYDADEALSAYNNNRVVILRVEGISGLETLDMTAVGKGEDGYLRFCAEYNGVFYFINEYRSTRGRLETKNYVSEYVINVTVDENKNITVDKDVYQIGNATKSGKQLLLNLYDEKSGISVCGQMSAKLSDNVYVWHMCLGNEYYQVTYESVYNEETEMNDDVWNIEQVTIATDKELDELEHNLNIDLGDVRDAVSANTEAIVRADQTPKQGSYNLITSGAVYNAVEEVSSIAKGRATGLVFETASDMETWLSDENNKGILKKGDNLYIKDIGVPDFWVCDVRIEPDAETGYYYEIAPLETQKVDLTEYIKNTDYATLEKAGVVKADTSDGRGVKVSPATGVLSISPATRGAIELKKSAYSPITPNNLEYAVEVCTNQDINTELTETQKKLPPSTSFVRNLEYGIRADVEGISMDIDDIKKVLSYGTKEDVVTIPEDEIVVIPGYTYTSRFPSGAALSQFNTYETSVKGGEKYLITCTVPADSYSGVALFFNENGYVGGVGFNDTGAVWKVIDYEVTIPPEATIMRTSMNKDWYYALKKVNYNTEYYDIGKIADASLKPIAYRIKDNELSVGCKYGVNKDLMITLRCKGVNNIFDFHKFGVVDNNDASPSLDFESYSIIQTSSTDWHAPFRVKLINDPNPGGDDFAADGTTYNYRITGGAHGYKYKDENNLDVELPTGRTESVRFFIDGRELQEGEGYTNHIEIRWSNIIQGYNTIRKSGDGLEILQENHVLRFDGVEWTSDVELLALRDLSILMWYGLQIDASRAFSSEVRYVGADKRGVYNIKDGDTTSNADNGGSKDCRKIICNDDMHKVEMELDESYDLGKRTFYSGLSGGTSYTYGKAYFNIINSLNNVVAGDRYYLRGKYIFSHM